MKRSWVDRSYCARGGLALVAACVALATGCGGLRGSGNSKSETRRLAPFKTIEESGVVDLDITAGRSQSVTVTGDDNLVPLVVTAVHDGHLRIRTKKPVRPELDLVVHIKVPNVASLSVSGISNVKLRDVESDALKVHVTGAAKITLAGATQDFNLHLSGAATVNAKSLRASMAHVTVSGAGKVKVYASQGLEVHLSGAGKVTYYGNTPNVVRDISGVGTIEKG